MSSIRANAGYSVFGPYPEKDIHKESWLDRVGVKAYGWLNTNFRSDPSPYFRYARKVEKIGCAYGNFSDAEILELSQQLKAELRQKGFLHTKLSIQAFALIREVAYRKLGMRHYPVQIVGGFVMLNGKISEMETGEGKTLTATLPAATVAMSGAPVHVVTVNDYLAKRDAEIMRPVYEALGLSVGVIQQDMSPEERKHAYQQDITYCTNNELTFDYLKDRLVIGINPSSTRLKLEKLYGKDNKTDRLLLRGLHFAIIDEADSVLVDEARTPLIISRSLDSADEREMYEQALMFAGKMQKDSDYTIDKIERVIHLTESGRKHLEDLVREVGGIWNGKQRREELVRKALSAIILFIKDKHYIVAEDKVQIVDEFTGRVMGDRSWEQGLHQLIEVKEGVELTDQRETLARISYQRFFRKYLYLSGMTGTASELAAELWSVYRLSTVKIPTNVRNRRKNSSLKVHFSAKRKWSVVVKRIQKIQKTERPVLVGTRSVEDSEHLSELLTAKGLEHTVLNARQDADEAAIIAKAGERGRITVATNMAGRGTDIKLADGIARLGGLHVILTELHESKRIDRQLIGRCARQGDRGSYEAQICLDDEIAMFSNRVLLTLAKGVLFLRLPFSGLFCKYCLRSGQKNAEKRNSAIREELLRSDEKQDDALAFTGKAT